MTTYKDSTYSVHDDGARERWTEDAGDGADSVGYSHQNGRVLGGHVEVVHTKPGPGEAAEAEGEREEGGGGPSRHDQGSQAHEERLAQVSSTGEQFPDAGGGQLPVRSDGVRQVAADLDHHRHQDVGEGGQEAGSVEAVVQHVPQEHGQGGEEGVEAPVLREVGDDDGPDRLAGQHGSPGRGGVSHLSVSQPDGGVQVLELLLRDLPVLLWGVLHTEPPEETPDESQQSKYVEDRLPVDVLSEDPRQRHADDCPHVHPGEGEGRDPALLQGRRPAGPDGVYGGIGDALGQAGQHPGGDQQPGVTLGQQRRDEGQHGRDGDPEQENSLPAILGGEVAARNLSEDVAVEEAGQNQALSLGIPVKIRILKNFRVIIEILFLYSFFI